MPSTETRYLVLVYNLNFDPSTCWGLTYEARIIPTLDIQCEDTAIPPNSLYATGSMLFSNRFKVGVDPAQAKFLSLPEGSSGGGCFVATASFGAADSSEVSALSSMRDSVLMRSAAGRAFVNAYYRLSPPAADAIRGNPAACKAARTALCPVVGLSRILADSGASAKALFAALAAAFAALVLLAARRTLRKQA